MTRPERKSVTEALINKLKIDAPTEPTIQRCKFEDQTSAFLAEMAGFTPSTGSQAPAHDAPFERGGEGYINTKTENFAYYHTCSGEFTPVESFRIHEDQIVDMTDLDFENIGCLAV